MNDFITVAEAARTIGVDPSQVRRYLRTGLLKGEKFYDRVWMVQTAAVNNFKRPRIGPNIERRKNALPAPETT